MNTRALTLLLAATILFSACGAKLIPGLDIQLTDTPDHRALLVIMAKYRQAYEAKDIDTLVSMTSERFYEDLGTPETQDDYNYKGLKSHFSKHFKQVNDLQLNITLKDVKVDGNQARMDYHYVTRYLIKLPSGERWQVTDELNRLELVKEGADWKVISGF